MMADDKGRHRIEQSAWTTASLLRLAAVVVVVAVVAFAPLVWVVTH